MITIRLPTENHTESLVLTHFCETHGPSVVFTTQSEYFKGRSHPHHPHNHHHHHNNTDTYIGNGIGGMGASSIDGDDSVQISDYSDYSDTETTQRNLIHSLKKASLENRDNNHHHNNSSNNVESSMISESSSNDSGDSLTNGKIEQQQPQNVYTSLSKLFSDSRYKQFEMSNIEPSTTAETKITSTFTINIPSNDQSSSAPSTPGAGVAPSTSGTSPASVMSSRCPTCSSLPQGTGLVSQDKTDTTLYYISTHQPSNNSYSSIRSACVRSLSCELVPGREGPVLIGSSDGCFLSYMFKVNDSRARGSARWYGFLFLLGDSACLVSYFSWVVGCFQKLAQEIKQRTNVVYNRERAQQPQSQTVLANMYRRGIRAGALKPLPEIADDPYLFQRLHRSFANLLAACRTRYHRLTGVPPALLNEQRLLMDTMLKHYIDENRISGEAQDFRSLLDAKLRRSAFPMQQELIVSLGQVCKILGESPVAALVYNVIVGNQVVVRGSHRNLVQSLLVKLADLLPDDCASVCTYSETFKEIWESNIVGLAPSVVIPRHVDRDIIAIVDIDYYDSSKEPDDIDHPDRSTIEITFSGPKYNSSMGNSIELILKQNYPPEVERIHLLNIKEEWINKTKAFYGVRSIIEDDKDKRLARFLQLINCTLEKDITILMFWTTCVRKLKYFMTQIERRSNQ